MVTSFIDDSSDLYRGRYAAELENALLALALVEAGGLPADSTKDLLRRVYRAKFNALAIGFESTLNPANLAWTPEGDGYRLMWLAPGDIVCPLAKIYPQEDGSLAVLVVAGVKDDIHDAMVQAEWAVARLTA